MYAILQYFCFTFKVVLRRALCQLFYMHNLSSPITSSLSVLHPIPSWHRFSHASTYADPTCRLPNVVPPRQILTQAFPPTMLQLRRQQLPLQRQRRHQQRHIHWPPHVGLHPPRHWHLHGPSHPQCLFQTPGCIPEHFNTSPASPHVLRRHRQCLERQTFWIRRRHTRLLVRRCGRVEHV
jgi:hypothetical protein